MILEWSLANFKSISDQITLQLAPLTLICGANSSGKSTIIQSMLLIAQTLGSPATDRPLILNGELVKLGFPTDVLFCGNEKAELEIGFSLSNGNSKDLETISSKVDTSFRSSYDPILNTRKMTLISTNIIVETMYLKLVPENEGNKLSRLVRNNLWNIPILLKADVDAGLYDFRLEIENRLKESKAHGYYASVSHFLPDKLVSFESVENYVKQVILECSRLLSGSTSSRPIHLNLKSPNGTLIKEIIGKVINVIERKLDVRSELTVQALNQSLVRLQGATYISEWLDWMQKASNARIRHAISTELNYYISKASFEISGSTNRNSRSLQQDVMPVQYQKTLSDIVTTFAKKLHYLGPLRDDPKMVYGIPPIPDSKEVGNKGEFTAAVLERFGNVPVQCPLPPQNSGVQNSIISLPLIEAVTIWLNHMGLVKKLQTYDQGKMGVQLSIQVHGLEQSIDLTNVGVGVSQILPILVTCLLAENGSTILLEQPELHLHPRIQMMLGDFFIGISLSGKQCIIETHSDRLINRVRRRIAEAEETTLMNRTRLYFVEKESATTRIIKVEPNEYGAIPDWPKGFFDEGLEEAQRIVEAATKKRTLKMERAKSLRNQEK